MSALRSLVEKPVASALDKTMAEAPPKIDAALLSAGTALTGTTTQAIALFGRLYGQATNAIAAWIPNQRGWILAQLAKAVVAVKASVAKL